jgi:hypothetical protein
MSRKLWRAKENVRKGSTRTATDEERHLISSCGRGVAAAVIAALSLLLGGIVSAQDTAQPSSAPPPADSAVTPEASTKETTSEEFQKLENLDRDLTVIRTKTDILSEFTDRPGNGWFEKLTLGTTYGFRLPGVSPEHEYGVRLQAPLAFADPGSGGGATKGGLGDIELKTGWAWIPDEVNRLGFFGNFKFNTATDDILGDNRNDYSLGLAGSHQIIPNRFSVFVLAEYLDTITREDGVPSRNALELSFNPSVRIVGPLAANFLFKDKLDFKADDNFALIEPGLSMLLAKHLGISTSIEIPIEDRSYTYIAKIGLVWFY